MKTQMTTGLQVYIKYMADACLSSYNLTNYTNSYCPAFFDRIVCWPPTKAGVRQLITCPKHMFPNANPNAFASRLCTNQSQWEQRSHYELCIGCQPNETFDSNTTDLFSIPPEYILARRYFIICANIFSIILLAIGIFILLGNSRLRNCSRNILHLNIFLVFLIRSIIQLIAELFMSKGYFTHNVFERVDACNRTTIYFKDHLVDCKLFTMFMNYINSSVSHWFVFCEALYLYRLLRQKVQKEYVRGYILTGWLVPLILTSLTYTTRYLLKKDLHTCWFEPSIYDWIFHGPNVVLQFLNFLIFNYICILLVRKLNKNYQLSTSSDRRRFAKYRRLTRSTLILLPLFGIHYFLFMWNTKPMLISKLILVHLTVHTIASSLQGLIVALVYTIFNSEVQREVLRSLNRCLLKHYPTREQPTILRHLLNKLEHEHIKSTDYPARLSTPEQYRRQTTQQSRTNKRDPNSSMSPSRDNSIILHQQEFNLLTNIPK